ncbi:MAG: ribosome maturation factor RimM [Alphaproteobacteria bacterium]
MAGQAGNRVVVGIITGAHGVRGLVRVKSYTHDPADLTSYGPLTDKSGQRVFALTLKGPHKGQFLAELEGSNSREDADALRGQKLHLDEALLPAPEDEDDFYIKDLIGLDLKSEDGKVIGRIKAMHDFGAGDVMEVSPATGGRTELWPFTLAIVPELHIADGWALCIPPDFTEVEKQEKAPDQD